MLKGGRWCLLFNRMAGSMVMMSMYGHRVAAEDDPYVGLAIEFMEASTNAITGRWVIDFFPLGLLVQVWFGVPQGLVSSL